MVTKGPSCYETEADIIFSPQGGRRPYGLVVSTPTKSAGTHTMTGKDNEKPRVIIRITEDTMRKARIFAARRSARR
jgi:hypothetical protein